MHSWRSAPADGGRRVSRETVNAPRLQQPAGGAGLGLGPRPTTGHAPSSSPTGHPDADRPREAAPTRHNGPGGGPSPTGAPGAPSPTNRTDRAERDGLNPCHRPPTVPWCRDQERLRRVPARAADSRPLMPPAHTPFGLHSAARNCPRNQPMSAGGAPEGWQRRICVAAANPANDAGHGTSWVPAPDPTGGARAGGDPHPLDDGRGPRIPGASRMAGQAPVRAHPPHRRYPVAGAVPRPSHRWSTPVGTLAPTTRPPRPDTDHSRHRPQPTPPAHGHPAPPSGRAGDVARPPWGTATRPPAPCHPGTADGTDGTSDAAIPGTNGCDASPPHGRPAHRSRCPGRGGGGWDDARCAAVDLRARHLSGGAYLGSSEPRVARATGSTGWAVTAPRHRYRLSGVARGPTTPSGGG